MKRKYFTIIFIVTILYINAFAQPVIKAQKDYGGNSDDIFISMYFTTDGGLIAGGFSFSNKSGNKTEDDRGLGDYWVIKLNSSGK